MSEFFKKFIMWSTVSLLILGAAGCQKPEDEGKSGFKLNESEIMLPSSAGQGEIGYSADKSVDLTKLTAESDVEWLSGFDKETEGVIRFSVDLNTDDAMREGRIIVMYDGDEYICKVVQEASGEFTLNDTKVEVPAEGGPAKVTYSVAASEVPEILTECADSWISDFDTSVMGEISFIVAPNEGTSTRESKVKVTCVAEDIVTEFTVRQLSEGTKEEAFTISIEKIEPTVVTYTIDPEDDQMLYRTMVVEKASFDKYENDEAFFQNDLEYMRFLSELMQGIPLSEYLKDILRSGKDTGIPFKDLRPETEHYIFAYGMTVEGERLTDIVKLEFATTAAERLDITFDIEYDLRNTMLDVMVSASDPNCYYYFSAMRTYGIQEGTDMADICQDYLNYVIEYATVTTGASIKEIMEDVCYFGIGVNSFKLVPENEYVIFACAVDTETGLVISDATNVYLTSGDIGPSDNKIEINFHDISVYDLQVDVTTTNSDPYVFCIDKAAKYADMTPAEIQDYLMTLGMDYFQREGDLINAPITDREPGVEYLAFAFGYIEGIATTDLVMKSFKTHAANESDIVATPKNDKYFEATELAKLYPEKFDGMQGYAVLPITLETSAEAGIHYFYLLVELD